MNLELFESVSESVNKIAFLPSLILSLVLPPPFRPAAQMNDDERVATSRRVPLIKLLQDYAGNIPSLSREHHNSRHAA